MLIGIFIFVMILLVVKPKSRTALFIGGTILWLVFALNTDNPDYGVYELIFQGWYADSVEPGFLALNNFAASTGIPFQLFFAILATFSLVCLFSAWKRWSGRLNGHSLVLLMVYPFFSMVTATRWTVAGCLTVWAISQYIQSKYMIKDKVFYLLFIIVAGSFHYSMLLFAFFIFVRPEKPSRDMIIKIGFITAGSAILFLSGFPTMVISHLIGTDKIMNWFSEENRIGAGIIIVYCLHFLCFYVFYYAYNACSGELRKQNKTDITLDRMLSVNIFAFLISGLYTFNMEFFSRIYVVIYLVNIAYINYIKWQCSRAKRQRITLLQSFYAISVSLFIYHSNVERVVLKILENNLLF